MNALVEAAWILLTASAVEADRIFTADPATLSRPTTYKIDPAAGSRAILQPASLSRVSIARAWRIRNQECRLCPLFPRGTDELPRRPAQGSTRSATLPASRARVTAMDRIERRENPRQDHQGQDRHPRSGSRKFAAPAPSSSGNSSRSSLSKTLFQLSDFTRKLGVDRLCRS